MPDVMQTPFMRNLAANGLMRIQSAAEAPTPGENTRGVVYMVEGASGAADTVKVILKSAADSYSAVTIATG